MVQLTYYEPPDEPTPEVNRLPPPPATRYQIEIRHGYTLEDIDQIAAEITPWGNPDPDRLPWVMCGLLRRPEEQWVFTQTPEPGDVVCRDCQTQVTACEALLAFLLRETARLASGSPAGSASPAPTNDREVA